ncbi:hypothetical protein EI42_05921 [Thermosporothrix hazakensis]|jgi:hypothetical protein|uniref:Uncharacterized protein n=1 Tax=Thermosporothrix hazakensis TaxID=644383 RepID=A0A326U8A3_THEHA|nr:hypothetical protein [Thermosporothrix hazakensis]PZW20548.1 hypothetical protein EI42_05921 [Thermosporothrix hazakensis]GCE51474.1 hypothetical protein KTH_63430 [Thermosporothrix hazakensis]
MKPETGEGGAILIAGLHARPVAPIGVGKTCAVREHWLHLLSSACTRLLLGWRHFGNDQVDSAA